MALVEETKIY